MAVPVSSTASGLVTTFMQDSARMARERGPVFHRSLFHLEFTFVSSAALATELSDERRFRKLVHPSVAVLRSFLGDGLLSADGDDPAWRVGHELLMPAFSQASMRQYHPVMLDAADQLIETWDQADGDPVDVVADTTKLSLEVIGRSGFGYSFDSFQQGPTHPFVLALSDTVANGQRTVTRPPMLGSLIGARAAQRAEQNIAYMNSVVDDVITHRLTSANDQAEDLLAIMLASDLLDPVAIRHQVLTFLAAGYGTTSGTLAFALYYLARDPEVLDRARAEVDAIWGNDEPTFDQVTKLRYLRRVVDETLRLWPTAPGYARQAREDTVLGGIHPMHAGDWVLVLLPAVHRDPVWGEDVESFIPDRFLPEQIKRRPPGAYKPFGTGERACIGRQFALHELVLTLGLLIRRYHLTLPPDYTLQVEEVLVFRPVGLTLHVRQR
ncbi:unspecific monooxygenase [Jatrophihabitans sp. GAS493]|uniref:cytochrome P450 n=1 Tax=Jatrophihabitans sp. GAS493 TaxID=1907575 RepID=UPI000BB84723|nr:unspecific monooxygenase [Jatrophihabitans sp. GAS493]